MSLESRIARSAEEVLNILGLSGCEVEIFLVPNEVIHEINREYRGKDKPTTVLSFEAAEIPHPETEYRHIGEIYLAPEYIASHNEDIRRFLVHGILHLLGYDHIERKDEIKMEKKENEVLKKAVLNI